jgi:hypothetical protein
MSESREPSSSVQENDRPESKPAAVAESDSGVHSPESPEELKQGTIDFDTYTKPVLGNSGVRRQGSMSEPVSGGSIVSWAEVLGKNPRSEDEVSLGSLPELQIDSISDNAIIKNLEREAKSSGIRRAPERRRLDPSPRPAADAPPSNLSGPEQEALAEEPSDIKDWFRDLNDDTGSAVDLNKAAQQARDSLKDSGGERPDETDVLAAALEYDDGTSKVNLGRDLLPVIGMSVAAQASVSPAPSPRPTPSPRPLRSQSRQTFHLRQPKNLNSWLGGAAIGVAGSAVVWTGLWLGGAFGSSKKHVELPPATIEVVAPKPTLEMARQDLDNGQFEQALGVFEQCEESSDSLTGRGQARWLTYLRQQRQHNAAPDESSDEVARARKDLAAARSADATLWLGLINETFAHYNLARETYDHGRDNFPDHNHLFTSARSRLDSLSGKAKLAPVSDPQLDRALALNTSDQMVPWWDAQAKLHYAGFKLDGTTPAQVIDVLLSSQRKYDDAMKTLTTTLNVEKAEDVANSVDGLVKQRQQAEENWKKAKDAARKFETDLAKKDLAFTAFQKSAAEELEKALSREAAARKALLEVAAARKTAEDSYQTVFARLRAANLVGDRATPIEIVGALDKLLSVDPEAKNAEIARLRAQLERSRSMNQVHERSAPPVEVVANPDPVRAERFFSQGLQLYYSRQYVAAEEQFEIAARTNDQDARILYFLGLTHLPLGKIDAAHDEFRRAADLERRGLPGTTTINSLFERIQGSERQLINRYRP